MIKKSGNRERVMYITQLRMGRAVKIERKRSENSNDTM